MAGNGKTYFIQVNYVHKYKILFLFMQMDMHELIDEHMKKQLHDSLAIKESSVTSVAKKPNRFMGLFQQFQFQR